MLDMSNNEVKSANPPIEFDVFEYKNGKEEPLVKYFTTIPVIPRVGEMLNLIYVQDAKVNYRDDMPFKGVVKSIEYFYEDVCEVDYVGFTSTSLTVRIVITT
jgi:hypothetical protein